jgi:hypothetical protein
LTFRNGLLYLARTPSEPGAQVGLLANAQALGDHVGRLEADALDVAGQAVRILPDSLNGRAAVGLEDAEGPAGAHPVPVQEDHDLPDGLLLLPGGGDHFLAVLADAIDGSKVVRVAVDDREGSLLERLHDPAGEHRADAFDHAAGEVLLDALDRGRRHRAQDVRLELLAVLLVDGPAALDLHPLPGPNFRQRADDGHQIAMAPGLDAQHAEAGFVVVESDTLHQAGDLLRLRMQA